MNQQGTTSIDGLVTLQERLVNLIKQLQIPLIEVSMVIGNHIKQMMKSLNEYILESGEDYPEKVLSPWPLNLIESEGSKNDIDLEKIISIVDDDRMDILSTLIRVTLIEKELDLAKAISALRMWEHLARSQLSSISTPGQLFSPLIIPEDW